METEYKPAHRDMALVNILDRMTDQLSNQDRSIEKILKAQADIVGELERFAQRQLARQDQKAEETIKKLAETTAGIERTATRQYIQQERKIEELGRQQDELHTETEKALSRQIALLDQHGVTVDKLLQDFGRYRSDMLGIAGEQSQIADAIREITKRQVLEAESTEQISQDISQLGDLYKEERKPLHEHYEQSVRQAEKSVRNISDLNHNYEKLHSDTEKRLGEIHKAVLHKLSEMESDVKRRLLALDGIEAALRLLLIRTEPPEKKPFIIKRILRRFGLLKPNNS